MLCWFFRFIISHSNDVDSPIHGITKRHINKCVNCRQFYDSCRLLKKKLPEDAAFFTQTSRSLNEQIIQNIGITETNISVRKINFHPIAVAAGIVFILLLSILIWPSRREMENSDEFGKAVSELSDMVNIDRGQELSRFVGMPFEAELQSIVDDIRAAIEFLYACIMVDTENTEEHE